MTGSAVRKLASVLVVVGAAACSDASPATEPDASTADGAVVDAADASPPLDAANDSDAVAGPLPPMPVISRKVPAFASSGKATDGNDDSYDTEWRSNETTSVATPSWLAYDLSSVAPANRGQVDVVWYSGGGYTEYDLYAKSGSVAYNAPRDYVIQGNAAPGGSLPSAGWIDLATITGNTYLSRQLPLNLTGYNWVRMFVTAINGTTFNFNTSVNLDVHDTSLGLADSWLFLGDSITAFASRNDGAGIGAQSFAQLIHASKPSYFPAAEGAGEGGWNSKTALNTPSPDAQGSLFDHWLKTFPGRFVGLSFGTNDGTDGPGDATPTYDNFVVMVKKVLAAGKVPCIPHVPWAQDAGHQTNAQLINAKLDLLYGQYPLVVKGPDLWGVLLNHPEWFQDGLHPNPQGREVYRQAWASAMKSAYP